MKKKKKTNVEQLRVNLKEILALNKMCRIEILYILKMLTVCFCNIYAM